MCDAEVMAKVYASRWAEEYEAAKRMGELTPSASATRRTRAYMRWLGVALRMRKVA